MKKSNGKNRGISYSVTVLHSGSYWAMRAVLTCVLEVDVIAIVCVLQFVGHHTESHDLLSDESVWPCDVHFYFGIIDLVGQPIVHDLRQVPAKQRERTAQMVQ